MLQSWPHYIDPTVHNTCTGLGTLALKEEQTILGLSAPVGQQTSVTTTIAGYHTWGGQTTSHTLIGQSWRLR